jgi:hypothetical protein
VNTDARRDAIRVAIAAVLCGLALAACGSSSKLSQPKSAASNQFLAFSECMRSHGIPNFPDPSGGGGGIRISLGSGINPGSPAFRAAQSQCKHLLPGGGPGGNGPPSAQAKQQMLAISECMRSHGVPDFPDPTTTAPASPTGYAAVLGRGGVFLAVPSTIDMNSPAFKQAATECKFGGGP